MQIPLYHIAPNFVVQNFREIAKNHMNVNSRDKNFVVATFFRDYCHLRGQVTLLLHPQFLHMALG